MSIACYAGTRAMSLLLFPAPHLVVLLEERELRDRFGAECEEHRRRVPRHVPRRDGLA